MKSSRDKKLIENTNNQSQILLRDYNLDLSFMHTLKTPQKKIFMKELNTFGAIDDQSLKYIQYTATISIAKLNLLINQYLKIYFLFEALEKTLNLSGLVGKQQVRVLRILQIIHKGEFYTHLRQNIIINNRSTRINANIVSASLVLLSSQKLSMQDIKSALAIFAVQQKQNESEGLVMNIDMIMEMLKKLNKTISTIFLKQWISQNTFEIQNMILPHEFLYLVCYTANRQYYLKKISRVKFKNVRMKDSKLYEVQPLQEVIGTPDFKIQQLLNQILKKARQDILSLPKYKKKIEHEAPLTTPTKRQLKISPFRKLLRKQEIYDEIKVCLNKNQEKSQNIKRCLKKLNTPKYNTGRHYSTITPLTNQFYTFQPNKKILLTPQIKSNSIFSKSSARKSKLQFHNRNKRDVFDFKRFKTVQVHISQMLI